MMITPINIELPERINSINTEDRIKSVSVRAAGAGYFGAESRIAPTRVNTTGTENESGQTKNNSDQSLTSSTTFRAMLDQLSKSAKPIAKNITTGRDGVYQKIEDNKQEKSKASGLSYILTVAPSESTENVYETQETTDSAYSQSESNFISRVKQTFNPERYKNTGTFVNVLM